MSSNSNKNDYLGTEQPPLTSLIAQESNVLPNANTELLQTLRIFWQLGDWVALEAFSAQDIHSSEARAECALYIASACFQLGLIEKGKTFQALALEWGVSKEDAGRVLISGVYNSLATASILTGKHESTALKHFVTAAEIAMPGLAVSSIVKARTQNQLEQLRHHSATTVTALTQLMARNKNQGNTPANFDAIKNTLTQEYQFDEVLKTWRRSHEYQFAYTDGSEIEQRILTSLKSCNDVSIFSSELLAHQTDWASEYHLSADRVNLLRPFTDQLKDKNILELGCGCGAITRFFGELGANTIAIEGSQQRASIAAERCRDLDNVSIVIDKLQNAPFSQQFDVVTLIGVLEYSQIYVDEPDPIEFVLKKAKSYLKPDGVLIVAIENQLGLKYFAGAPEDHGVGIMAGINDLYRPNTAVTFGRRELQERFLKAGFSNSDVYLALPDYKLPSVIVHPGGCQYNEHFNLGNLLSGTVFYDRQGIAKPLFSMEACWPLISRNNLIADLANSHLFIVHNTLRSWSQSSHTLASYYSPKRSAQNSQEVTFYLEGQDVLVKRKQVSKDSSRTETTEQYVPGILHSQLLHKIVQQPGWTLEQVEQWLQIWLDALEQAQTKQVAQVDGWPTYDKWLPENYLDAAPRNLIVNENGYCQFIDLEWSLPHQIPLPLILYRGLLVTLSTITSIAQPADSTMAQGQPLLDALLLYCGYKLTPLDYQVFVPVIESLSKNAQGLPLPTTLATEAIKLNPFNVREPIGATQDNSNCMTLYWRQPSTTFDEECTIKHSYPISRENQHISLQIPAQQEEYSRFRLDIGERPGCYQIAQLQFCDKNDTVLWQWDFDSSHLSHSRQLVFYRAADQNNGICLISDGYDPQFELNLSSDVLHAISRGGVLKIDLCSYS